MNDHSYYRKFFRKTQEKSQLSNTQFYGILKHGRRAAASLLHIPKEKIRKALGEIKRVIKDGGIGFIALKKGEGEKVVVDEDDEQDKRFFAYWQKEEFKETLKNSGFEVLDFLERPVSAKTTWLVFFVKNNS